MISKIKKYVGDEVHLRGLIEFSNICKRNYLYCGLRASNKNVKRYRLEPEEIIELAKRQRLTARKLYALYPGKICINDTPGHYRACITGKITTIGRKFSEGYGFRKY